MAAGTSPEPAVKILDEDSRRLAGAAIAGAALGWWPAFTLRVYGVIFFEQHLALWAAATSAFLALGVKITVFGMPAVAAFMVRVLTPTAERLGGLEKVAAVPGSGTTQR